MESISKSPSSGMSPLSLKICLASNQYTKAIAFLPLLLTGTAISTKLSKFSVSHNATTRIPFCLDSKTACASDLGSVTTITVSYTHLRAHET